MIEGLNLSLPTRSWVALQALIRGEDIEWGDLSDLQARGVVENGSLTDVARELLHALAEPVGLVELYLSEAGKLRGLLAFVDSERISLLVQMDGEWTILRRVDQGMLPLALIELLRISPRKSGPPGASDLLPAKLFQDLFDRADDVEDPPHEDLARSLRPMWPDIYTSIVDGEWRYWTLEAYALMEESTRSRGGMAVFDASKGMLRLQADPDEEGTAKVTAVMPSDIWIDIVTLISPAT